MRTTTLGLLAVVWLAVAEPASAGLIPGAVTVTAGAGFYQFKYDVHLPSDYRLKSGDFFTIYDFHGYVAGHNLQPADWTFSTSLLGPNPPKIHPVDSSSELNITWTYHGPDLITPASLGLFQAASSLGPHTGDVEFASQDHRKIDGRPVGNFTIVDGPDPRAPAAPEPASLMLVAAGAPLVGIWMARRRRAR
jgi:hypothetical protein